MEIKPKTLDSKSLLSRNYRIPFYQRPYCWKRDNIVRLLNDIEVAQVKKPLTPYYIGNVITSAPLSNDGTISESTHNFDILDGQQRFTTLMMIASYLDLVDVFQTTSGRRLTLQLDQEEGAAFESLLQAHLINWSNMLRLPKALQEAAGVIVNWFDNITNKEHFKEDFKTYLSNQVKFFEINLSALIDGAHNKTIATINYYDNLNTSGKQLEPLDVLKGLLFAKLDRNEVIKAASIWNNAFNQKALVESADPPKSTTLFDILKDPLTNPSGTQDTETPKQKRFRLVKDWELVALVHYSLHNDAKKGSFVPGELQPREIVESYTKPMDFIQQLAIIDEWLNKFFINQKEINEESPEKRYYLPEEEGGKKDVRTTTTIKNLSLLQFLLHSIYNDRPHTWLQPLINKMVTLEPSDVSFKKILDILARQLVTRLTELNTLEGTLPSLVYGQSGVRLYLTLIEYVLAKDESPFKVRRNIGRSVEHIYPQNWGQKEGGIELDKIYNLALLKPESNSGYSDRDFAGKKAYFISNNGSGPYESLRLKDYYSEVEPITLSKSNFEKVAQKHHNALVIWASGVSKSTDQ